MNPIESRSALLVALMERPSWSVVMLLAGLCRRSTEARDWLCEDFGRNAKTRENFVALLDNGAALPPHASDGFAELAGEARSWREEARRMRTSTTVHAPGLYGGLTWEQMEKLVRRYEAGALDLGVFLLARDWRKAGEAATASPRLLRAAGQFLDAVIRSGETRLLSQLKHGLELLNQAKPATLRTAFGYADWWKLHALLYMLRHPRESYRTRDVRAHLASVGLRISSLDFRRFCRRHGIRRDMRAGRPRTRT